jgi:hypothetical protein
MASPRRPLNISHLYTIADWEAALASGPDWEKAIDIAGDRIRSRWIDPAERILGMDGAGFAIVALDCIILESLWGFIHGVPVRRREGAFAYREILSGPRFNWSSEECDGFRCFVRNGLMHDAETRSRWRIERTIPKRAILEKGADGYLLNRTTFHNAIKLSVEDWVGTLRSGDAERLEHMRKRMNTLIATHYA